MKPSTESPRNSSRSLQTVPAPFSFAYDEWVSAVLSSEISLK